MVKTYEVKGKFLMGEEIREFVKEYRAESEKRAIERVYSDIGSKHKTPRKKITIIEVKAKGE